MPSYHYRAITLSGFVAQGQMTATCEEDLARSLQIHGLELVKARPKNMLTRPWQTRHRTRSLVLFTQQMRDILSAGVPFAEALQSVTHATKEAEFRDVLLTIMRALRQGSNVAQAFAAHKIMFSPTYNAILSAGNASGDMVTTFIHLATYVEVREELNRHIIKSVRYPLMLLSIASCVFIFMMTMVVPQIVQFLQTLDIALPFSTRALIYISHFMTGWGLPLFASCVVISLGFYFGTPYMPAAQILRDRIILRTPLLGMLVKGAAEARFLQSFSLLLQSNLGILASLREARATLSNVVLQGQIAEIERRVTHGSPLSDAAEGILSPLTVRMMRAGEYSGNITKSAYQASISCQKAWQEKVDHLLAMLEPGLTIVMGFILASIVLAVLGPIYNNLAELNIVN